MRARARGKEREESDFGLLSRAFKIAVCSSRARLQYVAAADLHVSASTHEAFPLNTLEAMLLSVPVLATPAFGSEEQIFTPWRDGLLMDDINSFAEFYEKIR